MKNLRAIYFSISILAFGLLLSVARADPPKGKFYLVNMFLEKKEMRLEGNDGKGNSDHHGAAFMHKNEAVTGQIWKAIPSSSKGYFYLTTLFVEKDGMVLEGNDGNAKSDHHGAAFMHKKEAVTGQLWKAVPSSSKGYFYLTTMLVEKEGMVLEGNDGNLKSDHKGAAFMHKKADVTGQFWRFVPTK